jgi:putative membrane protein
LQRLNHSARWCRAIFGGTTQEIRMKPTILSLAACAAVALAACTTEHVALNAPPAPAAVMGAPAAGFNATDRAFALGAATSNLFEIGAAQLASKRTGQPDVLALATAMYQQHTASFNQLAAIMHARGVAVPNDLSPDKQIMMNKLGTARGGDFDQLFVQQAGFKEHQADIATFQRDMPRLADPDLRNWAQQTLPVLEQHLAMAQQVASRVD